MKCDKRQREIVKGEEQHRCVHPESEVKNLIVDEKVCTECPLLKLKIKTCKDRQREARMAKAEAYFRRPPPSEGSTLQSLDLQPGFVPCPFRQGGKEPKCQVTGLGVTPETCERCSEEAREQEASLGKKMSNYFWAVRKWVQSGRPTRTEEEIKNLFENHCKQCERYDKKKHACKSCGCLVSTDSTPLRNKLAMATEGCPLGQF
jgi:hypothetical protein